MSETELKATEKIASAFETSETPSEQPVTKKKRPVTMTDAKKQQLAAARLRLQEQRKQKKTEPADDDTKQKHEEIKSWVHGICKDYLTSYQPAPSTASGPVKQAPVPPAQVPRMSKEDYFLSIIRKR